MDKLRKVQLLRPLTLAIAILAGACVLAVARDLYLARQQEPTAAEVAAQQSRLRSLRQEVDALTDELAAVTAERDDCRRLHEAEASRNRQLREALEEAAARLKKGTQ